MKLRYVLAVVLALLVSAACSGGSSPDGNTSWMGPCEEDQTCRAGLACVCGVCSQRCGASGDCSGLGEEALCSFELPGPACASVHPGSGLCVPRTVDAGSGDGPSDASGQPPDGGDVDARAADVEAGPADATFDAAEGGLDGDAGHDVSDGSDSGQPDGADAAPACADSDSDTVCDAVDVCPGFPDLDDADGDGRPDGCEPTLLQDMNTSTAGSSVTGIAATADAVYLAAHADLSSGPRLWRMDIDGSAMTRVDYPGDPATQAVYSPVAMNEKVFFTLCEGNECGLWVTTNGEAAVRITDQTTSSGWYTRVIGDHLYFWSTDPIAPSFELWRTDGTPTGTTRLASGPASLYHLASFGDGATFLLQAEDGTRQLWATDGTSEGTHALAVVAGDGQLGADDTPSGPIYFSRRPSDASPNEVWVSDGTAAGTRRADLPLPDGEVLSLANTPLGLFAMTGDPRSGFHSWIVVPGGSAAVEVMAPMPYGASGLFATTSGLYLVAAHVGIYRIDGSGESEEVFVGRTSDWIRTDRGLYFIHPGCECGASDRELYRLDEQGAVRLLAGLPDYVLPALTGAVSGERLVFMNSSEPEGIEPWISDGTRAGTRLLADATTRPLGSDPRFGGAGATVVRMLVRTGKACQDFFSCNLTLWTVPPGGLPVAVDEANLRQAFHFDWGVLGDFLFVANGVPGGPLDQGSPLHRVDGQGSVQLVSSDVRNLGSFAFPFLDDALIVGESGLVAVPLADLTNPSPTVANLRELGAGPSGSAAWTATTLPSWGGWAWFLDADRVIWRTDGTGLGTVRVGKQMWRDPLLELGDALHFFGDDGLLYRTRGLAGDVEAVMDLTGTDVQVTTDPQPVVLGDWIHFNAVEGGQRRRFRARSFTAERYADDAVEVGPLVVGGRAISCTQGRYTSTDGDAPPTLLHENIDGACSTDLVVYRGRAYFAGQDAEHGRELWRTDGTPEGTQLEADLEPGPDGAHPYDLHATPEALFFGANVSPYGAEPWVLRH